MNYEKTISPRVTINVSFLIDIFDHHGIDWKSWTVKTIDHLVDDLSKGERTLSYTNGAISLNSKVASCEIYFGGKQLVVICPVYPTGTLIRNIPCSVKLGMNETPKSGIIRKIKVELGLDLDPTYLSVTKEDRHQSYYPGLGGAMTHYRFATPLHPDQYKETYTFTEDNIPFTFNWVEVNKENI